MTATLSGSGSVVISTGGGLLHHRNLGPGFADGTDFDSSQPGDQTVPDTGQWAVNVTGGGHDSVEVDEGEATNPVSYAFGHTFFPGGTPCVLRDPNDRQGIVAFSLHPAQETRICYPAGINQVIVRAGSGAIEYGVLDTAPGVPLHLYGGPGSDEVTEAANTPTEVGGYHEPVSPVYFTAGSGDPTIAYDDGPVTSPATYTIGNGAIIRKGMPPLYYTARRGQIELYPQMGPSTINIDQTGGIPVQVFGNFFGQTGPDRINGTDADAPLFITGSVGNDTITDGPVGGFIDGGGGNDTITSRNDAFDQVDCAAGSSSTVFADTLDMVQSTCATVHRAKPLLPLEDVAFAPARVTHGAKLTLAVPIYAAGSLQLSFARVSCKHGHSCHKYVSAGTITVKLKTGTTSVKLGPKAKLHRRQQKLPSGTYRVSAVLSSHGLKSAPLELPLAIH